MLAIKSVQQHYTPNPEILRMLEEFREMLNDCVRVGVADNVTSLKSLSTTTYGQLAAYDMMSASRTT
jgi:putative transposase